MYTHKIICSWYWSEMRSSSKSLSPTQLERSRRFRRRAGKPPILKQNSNGKLSLPSSSTLQKSNPDIMQTLQIEAVPKKGKISLASKQESDKIITTKASHDFLSDTQLEVQQMIQNICSPPPQGDQQKPVMNILVEDESSLSSDEHLEFICASTANMGIKDSVDTVDKSSSSLSSTGANMDTVYDKGAAFAECNSTRQRRNLHQSGAMVGGILDSERVDDHRRYQISEDDKRRVMLKARQQFRKDVSLIKDEAARRKETILLAKDNLEVKMSEIQMCYKEVRNVNLVKI